MGCIGSATMEDEGTIVLDLRAEIDGVIGDARFTYLTSDANYPAILEHLQPIKPGESKLCPPWE